MVVNSQRGKTAAFGKTRYVVRIVEHGIEFSMFYINCDRNGPIDIIRNIIQFLYCCVCYGAMIVNAMEVKNNFK